MPTEAEAIVGRPEGRQGVWLIEAEQACALIDAAPGDEIHNFIGHDTTFIGADWDKAAACELVRRNGLKLAMVFAPNVTMRHQLVAITSEERWAFDVGEISEERMIEPDGNIECPNRRGAGWIGPGYDDGRHDRKCERCWGSGEIEKRRQHGDD